MRVVKAARQINRTDEEPHASRGENGVGVFDRVVVLRLRPNIRAALRRRQFDIAEETIPEDAPSGAVNDTILDAVQLTRALRRTAVSDTDSPVRSDDARHQGGELRCERGSNNLASRK